MASQSKPTSSHKNRVSQVSSTGNHTDILMEILNKNYQESTSCLKSDGFQGKGSKKTNPRRSTSRNPNIRATDIPNGRAPYKRFSTHERTPRPSNSYQRPTGPEIVRPHIPSCSSLPQNWCPIHDRFIAYLATHAPLTENGKIPSKEELSERWKTTEIVRLVRERFPKLGGERIKVSVIEKRLALLDEAGDNDYFKMRYGAYKSEEWGEVYEYLSRNVEDE